MEGLIIKILAIAKTEADRRSIVNFHRTYPNYMILDYCEIKNQNLKCLKKN